MGWKCPLNSKFHPSHVTHPHPVRVTGSWWKTSGFLSWLNINVVKIIAGLQLMGTGWAQLEINSVPTRLDQKNAKGKVAHLIPGQLKAGYKPTQRRPAPGVTGVFLQGVENTGSKVQIHPAVRSQTSCFGPGGINFLLTSTSLQLHSTAPQRSSLWNCAALCWTSPRPVCLMPIVHTISSWGFRQGLCKGPNISIF